MSEDSGNPTETNLPLDFLGDGTQPLEIKSIAIDADGTVSRRPPPSPFRFCFTYLEVPFSASVSENGGDLNLHIEADLGPLPYSAEAPKLRKPLLALLDALKDEGKFRLSLSPEKRIILEGEMPVEYALTPVNIISSLTTLLIHTDPYLELITNQLLGGPNLDAANSNVNGADDREAESRTDVVVNGADHQADDAAKDPD